MKVIWTKEDLEKLSEIEEFISRDSPNRAESFINFLIEQGETLLINPLIGRVVPEILNPAIRELLVKNYRIVYRVKKDTLEVITVFEGHRLLRIDEIE